ncbi:MAG: hypothetical protein ACRC92_15550 [Peptostreptococcaceae bacterium]
MKKRITSKNSWELLLSSIAGAWDAADTFVLGTFDEAENYSYKVKVTNSKTNEEITKYITQIKVSIPDSSEKISSMKAEFILDKKVVKTDDVIVIEVFNSTESIQIKLLEGKAKITNREISKIYNSTYTIEVVDEFDKLFEKIVSEDMFLFNKYIYAEQYKENSILYMIAKSLGFTDEQLNFEDVRDSQSRLVQIPFMLLRKDNRYIDELQTILEVTKGRIYVDFYKNIVFKNGLFDYEKAVAYQFDTRNILRSIGEGYKYTDKNGVRILYDSYKYLENQVIFDLANRVEVKVGTNLENQKMEFNIKFITDLAVQHNITKAEGYYYVDEEQIRVPLQEGVHYELVEFKETSSKVKFFNPYSSLFFIDKFEIKGIPLVQFQDNEVAIKETKNMEEREENFSSYTKNKYIQTEELASDIARVEYIKNCKNKKEYSFKSNFVPHLEPGDVCSFKLDDIDTLIEISSIEHTLSRSNGCYSEITALEYERIEQEFNYSKIESLTSKDSFLGTLNNIKDQIDETDKKLDEIILIEGARGYVDENDPRGLGKPIAEPDVWFNPITKEFKVWRNGKWNPAREEDIPPALMIALKAQAGVFRIGGNDVEAGIFFQYDKDTNNPVFKSTDSENLAQVSIDKDANVLIRNANNKLAFNMRNPENPTEIISQILMGVYNADDIKEHKNTLFQVGDESTGTYLKFLRNGNFIQQIDNKEIKQYFKEFENQIDGKINTFSQTADPSVVWIGDKKLKSVGDLWYNPTTKVTKRWNGKAWEEQDVKDKVAQEIAKSKNTVFVATPVPPYKRGDLWIKNQEIYDCISTKESGVFAEGDWKKSTKYTDDTTANNAINNQSNGHLTINANTVFGGDATFVSRGSNETTVIKDGSISFTRSGETITTIRNMRAGIVTTDGYGTGYVDFVGMKSNLLILPSIKAFDVSANVRSLNCKVEKDPNFLAQNRYRFFVYGTEEVYEGVNKEVKNSQNYVKNSYSVGVEGIEISLYGARVCENFWTTDSNQNTYWTNVQISGTSIPCKIGIKVYINNAYYGESLYDINHSYFSLRKDGSHHYLRLNVPRVKISLGNFSLTTKNKGDKTVRIELYLKDNPSIICSGTIWEHRGGRDHEYWAPKPHSANIACKMSSSNITFYVGHYFYSPSYIQNIVGAGEIQYLAIEQ